MQVQTELVETGELKRSLEAILFVATESLSIDALVKLTGASHVEVAETLAAIAEDFAGRGIVLREIAGGYRFASAPSAKHVVEAYLLPPKTNLSPAAMETLAIVAYLQPVTRAEIEAIRGVNVDGVVQTLADKRFIAEAGRREGPGRPMEYRSTDEFLEAFGLRSLSELPPVDLESENLELALPIPTTLAITNEPIDGGELPIEDSAESDSPGSELPESELPESEFTENELPENEPPDSETPESEPPLEADLFEEGDVETGTVLPTQTESAVEIDQAGEPLAETANAKDGEHEPEVEGDSEPDVTGAADLHGRE